MKLAKARFARGYTLIELLVVLAIMGVLAAAIMPLGEAMVTAQKERELRRALWEIRGAIDEYKRVHDLWAAGNPTAHSTSNGYPASLQTLVDGVSEQGSEVKPDKRYFLRRIPRDPFADPQLPAEQTWVLRSYASSAANPQPGADVYDISSSSTARALDGSRYSDW